MAKIKIEGLSSDFSQYEWLEEYEHVFPLLIQDFDWFEEVIHHYPQPELLRHYWDEAILEFLHYIAMYRFLEGECVGNHHLLASPRIDTVDWLIKRIRNIKTARIAFERFIKPETATGKELLNKLNIDGFAVDKEAKDGE